MFTSATTNCKVLKGASAVTRDEILKLESYLKKTFRMADIEVRQRPQKDDSAEVYIGDEFIGILFRDDEDPDDTASARWPFWTTTSSSGTCVALGHALTTH